MKVALIHLRQAYSGGVELYLNEMARYLCKKGHDVTIICRSHADKAPHENVNFVKLKGFSLGKTHRLWKFAKSVEKHINNSDYDLVYGLGHAWSNDVLRIGAGTSMHQSQSLNRRMRLKDRVNHIIERKAMSAAKHIICNSHKTASEIKEAHNIHENKITVIHNFVDTKRFDRERVKDKVKDLQIELGLDKSKPIFLFLGTGYERKGLKQTLTALSKLKTSSQLLIVGKDSQEHIYINYAKKLGVYDNCYFLGEDKRPELYFPLADCYLLPTLYEPFGFTVIESLSCGTPAITTENCGAKEILTPDVSTVIGSEVNPEELAKAMEYWIKQRKDKSLHDKCRNLALTMDVETVMEKNYQQLLTVCNNPNFDITK